MRLVPFVAQLTLAESLGALQKKSGITLPSAKGAKYDSQGQVQAKRARRPWTNN
jgi:hypothetical protein